MSVKYRVAFIVVVVFSALFVASYWILRAHFSDAFLTLEQERAHRDLARATNAIRTETESLATLATDWATWDDSYAFVQTRDAHFIESNLVENTFTDTPLNTLRYYDLQGRLVWGRNHSQAEGWDYQISGLPLEDLAPDHPWLQIDSLPLNGMFVGRLGELYLFSVQAITDSSGTQPVRGLLLMGQRLDGAAIRALGGRVEVNMRLYVGGAPVAEGSVPQAEAIPGAVQLSIALSDIFGEASVVLVTQTPRDISELGHETTRQTLLLLLMVGLALMLSVLLGLQSALVRPLRRLQQRLDSISRGNETVIRADAYGAAELRALASCFEGVLEAREANRRALEVEIAGRERIEQALRRAAQEVAPVVGESFLLALVRHLVAALPVDYALLGSLVEDDDRHVNVVAGYGPNGPLRGFGYVVEGAPCERVLQSGSALYSDGLLERFPNDALLQQRGMQSYAGTVLKDAKGRAIGLISVLAKTPLEDGETVLNTLRVFADRAAAELSRERQALHLRKLSSAVEQSPSMVVITDVNGLIEYVNPKFSQVTGYAANEVLGQPWRMFQQEPRSNPAHNGRRSERRYQHKNGQMLWLAESRSPIINDAGDLSHYVILLEDVSEQRELADKLAWQASHDALTGLANRTEFERRVDELNAQAGSSHALCYLDLDQFKVINDTCGHVAGDELLRQLAQLLCDSVDENAVVARLGGDEFAMCLPNSDELWAVTAAETVRHAIEDFQFYWEEKRFRVGVSIGLVMIQAGLHSLTEWLKRADSACFAAKDGGRNRIHLFSEDDHELAARQGEMEWVARLTNALDDGYFSLYFQPIIPINDAPQPGAHVELLLRLEEPGGEPTPPGAFLPAAERYGLVPRLDRWVVNATFNWLCDLRRREVELPYCSVNLSGTSLSDEHFLHEIIAKLNSTGLPAELLCFEITETAAIANLARATVFIKTLKSRGCRFALDDFGSGLSSFGYLKQLPVDYLKIDGMFVRDIVDDPIDQAMVRSINEIGHVLGKQTIAEFVENDQVNQLLVEIGIDFVQGYGVAVPLPLSAFAEREMLVSD